MENFVQGIVTSLGFGTMMGVGAIVFGIGTIVFILEMIGFSFYIKPFGIRRNNVKWNSMAFIKVAIVAALFGGSLAATASIVFVPGIAYLRPAQVLAVVFGGLFGLPGAVGIALGNFIADLFAGTLTLGSVAGFIGNFLTAYVIYRILNTENKVTLKNGVKGVLLFMWALFVSAFVIAFYIPFWLALLNIIPAEVAWTAVFVNIILNGTITGLVLGPILLKILFKYIKNWNMYWKDNLKFTDAEGNK